MEKTSSVTDKVLQWKLKANEAMCPRWQILASVEDNEIEEIGMFSEQLEQSTCSLISSKIPRITVTHPSTPLLPPNGKSMTIELSTMSTTNSHVHLPNHHH